MSDWQPIKTAPKDGTEILAYGDVEWPTRVAIGRFMRGGSFFWDVDDTNSMGGDPTHWMPLPDPPKT